MPLNIFRIVAPSPVVALYFISMPDWKLSDEIQKEATVFGKLMHSLLGIYACVFLFPSSISLHLVNMSADMSGSCLSTLNGIFFAGRRDSVGPWSALSMTSIGHGVTPISTDILFR